MAGGTVEKILKYRKLTTPMSKEALESDIFKPYRDQFEVLEEYQPEVNKKYEEFLIKHSREEYFKIEQMDTLGYKPDIYIALTKRNCGKTYSYMRLCAKLIEKGEEFVIVRNSQREVSTAVVQQFRDYSGMFPNEIVVKSGAVYERIYYEEEKGKRLVEKHEDRLVGYLAYLSGKTQAYQGSSYPKAKTIIGDEATNAGQTTKETTNGINAFGQLVITFFRGKKGCKMYIFGNLMSYQDSDGNTRIADSLIRDLGITPEDNMKYIVRSTVDKMGNRQEIKLLYLNTRDLYNSYGLTTTNILMNTGKAKALQENRPSTSGKNIVGELDFIRSYGKLYGLHGRYANKDYVIQIAGDPDIPIDDHSIRSGEEGNINAATGRFYIIRVTNLDRSTLGFGMPIFTDNPVTYSTHRDILTLTKKMPKLGYSLEKILKKNLCLFVGDASYMDLYLLMGSHKHYIEEYKQKKQAPLANGRRRKKSI